MKKNRIQEIITQFGKVNIYITIIVLVVFIMMSVGYAEFQEQLSAIGQVTLEGPKHEVTNKIEFTRYEVINRDIDDGISVDYQEINDGFNVTTKIKSNIEANEKYQIRYTLYNGTLSNYTYLGSDAVLGNKEYLYLEISGIIKGDIIKPGETRDVIVTFTNSNVTNYEIDTYLVLTFKKDSVEVIKPQIMGEIKDTNILLNEKNEATIGIYIANLYDCAKELRISILNPDIVIISNENILINKDTTEEVSFTLKLNQEYQNSLTDLVIVTTKDGEKYTIGEITLYKE